MEATFVAQPCPRIEQVPVDRITKISDFDAADLHTSKRHQHCD